MVRIIWSSGAAGDLNRITEYLLQLDPEAARSIPQALVEAGNGLIHFPRRGRLSDRGWRELPVRPYIISYRVDDDAVEILNVRHMAQDR